jgi:hypothetical protein
MTFFTEVDTLKIDMEPQRYLIVKAILSKKSKAGDIAMINSKTYYKATATKAVGLEMDKESNGTE